MKFNIKTTVIGLIIFLIVINIYLCVQSLFLGETILKLEEDIKKLSLENLQLEKKVFSLNSVESLEKKAQTLGFTKKAEPIYLENLKYAFR